MTHRSTTRTPARPAPLTRRQQKAQQRTHLPAQKTRKLNQAPQAPTRAAFVVAPGALTPAPESAMAPAPPESSHPTAPTSATAAPPPSTAPVRSRATPMKQAPLTIPGASANGATPIATLRVTVAQAEATAGEISEMPTVRLRKRRSAASITGRPIATSTATTDASANVAGDKPAASEPLAPRAAQRMGSATRPVAAVKHPRRAQATNIAGGAAHATTQLWESALEEANGDAQPQRDLDRDTPNPLAASAPVAPLRTYAYRRPLHGRYGLHWLPEVNVIQPVAALHAAIMAIAALTAVVLLSLDMTPAAFWALALAFVVGPGAGVGYLASEQQAYRLGAIALILSELGALGWTFLAFGPQPALLLLLPALLALALGALGRWSAALALLGALALYLAAVAATLAGSLHPAIALSATQLLVFQSVCAVLAGLVTLGVMLSLVASRARATAIARASQHEAAFLHMSMMAQRERMEDDALDLQHALAEALRGRGIPPTHTLGPLHPLAETINLAAERLVTLQRDREDRLRLEGALRAVVRAVERAWLGLPWSWPEPSATSLDELVAFLRTPRPFDPVEQRTEEPGRFTANAGRLHDGMPEETARQPGLQPDSDAPAWLYSPSSWPGAWTPSWPQLAQSGPLSQPSWPDPWPDEDAPDDSASRHLTPPPVHRRWNDRQRAAR
ncbi:MAG: hypothetical protein ABI068_13785 [Ktedonobacterales bacterium]